MMPPDHITLDIAECERARAFKVRRWPPERRTMAHLDCGLSTMSITRRLSDLRLSCCGKPDIGPVGHNIEAVCHSPA